MEDLESSTKKNSVKISSQFLKFSVFRAQFSGSHFGNSQFRSEILRNIDRQSSRAGNQTPVKLLLAKFLIGILLQANIYR